MKLGEFFIALGFDVDDKKLKEFNDQLKDGVKDMLKMSAVAAGAVYAINAFVSGSVEAATALRNFNTETGNSAEALQKWQVASTLTNAAISADQVTASFQSMAAAISDVTMGKGPSGQFAMLGVGDVRGRDVSDVMEELRQNFDKNVAEWGLPQTVNLMKEVGFDPGMLNALKMTRLEFDRLIDGKILDPESREKLVALGDAIAKFKWEFQFFKDQTSAEWSPRLIEVLETAVPLMKDFAESVHAVGQALADLWNGIDPEWQKTMIAIATGMLAYFNPVTAVFVALAAAIWDVGRALRGIESFTGKSILWLLNLMESEDGSKVAEWKKALEEAGNGQAKGITPRRTAEQNKALADQSLPNMLNKMMLDNMLPEQYVMPKWMENQTGPRVINAAGSSDKPTVSNVWHIQSTGDPETLAELIAIREAQILNTTLADQNNGPRY